MTEICDFKGTTARLIGALLRVLEIESRRQNRLCPQRVDEPAQSGAPLVLQIPATPPG